MSSPDGQEEWTAYLDERHQERLDRLDLADVLADLDDSSRWEDDDENSR